mgnify:CR=1 FL=1
MENRALVTLIQAVYTKGMVTQKPYQLHGIQLAQHISKHNDQVLFMGSLQQINHLLFNI